MCKVLGILAAIWLVGATTLAYGQQQSCQQYQVCNANGCQIILRCTQQRALGDYRPYTNDTYIWVPRQGPTQDELMQQQTEQNRQWWQQYEQEWQR